MDDAVNECGGDGELYTWAAYLSVDRRKWMSWTRKKKKRKIGKIMYAALDPLHVNMHADIVAAVVFGEMRANE